MKDGITHGFIVKGGSPNITEYESGECVGKDHVPKPREIFQEFDIYENILAEQRGGNAVLNHELPEIWNEHGITGPRDGQRGSTCRAQ